MKPENLLVQLREGQGPRVHLVDFGMTRRKGGDPLTRLQEGMSTLRYMAPENINRSDVDGRSDVYSMGCILYECLTGRHPFDRDTEGAVLYAHMVEPPPRVTWLRGEQPQAIVTVVPKALNKDSARR